jgi:hypothetical protein
VTVKADNYPDLSDVGIEYPETLVGRRVVVLLVKLRHLRDMHHFLYSDDAAVPADKYACVIKPAALVQINVRDCHYPVFPGNGTKLPYNIAVDTDGVSSCIGSRILREKLRKMHFRKEYKIGTIFRRFSYRFYAFYQIFEYFASALHLKQRYDKDVIKKFSKSAQNARIQKKTSIFLPYIFAL